MSLSDASHLMIMSLETRSQFSGTQRTLKDSWIVEILITFKSQLCFMCINVPSKLELGTQVYELLFMATTFLYLILSSIQWHLTLVPTYRFRKLIHCFPKGI